ncbi:MAG: hypothetical protein ACK4FA_02165 [Candidatus Paceibacteria bacterium]
MPLVLLANHEQLGGHFLWPITEVEGRGAVGIYGVEDVPERLAVIGAVDANDGVGLELEIARTGEVLELASEVYRFADLRVLACGGVVIADQFADVGGFELEDLSTVGEIHDELHVPGFNGLGGLILFFATGGEKGHKGEQEKDFFKPRSLIY